MNTFTDRMVIEMFYVIPFKGWNRGQAISVVKGTQFLDFLGIFSKSEGNIQISIEEF